MWSEGAILVPKEDGTKASVRYFVKHFDEPSEWGIEGGRISKLCLKAGDRDIASYDRGWDVRPESEEAQVAFAILMNEYN